MSYKLARRTEITGSCPPASQNSFFERRRHGFGQFRRLTAPKASALLFRNLLISEALWQVGEIDESWRDQRRRCELRLAHADLLGHWAGTSARALPRYTTMLDARIISGIFHREVNLTSRDSRCRETRAAKVAGDRGISTGYTRPKGRDSPIRLGFFLLSRTGSCCEWFLVLDWRGTREADSLIVSTTLAG